MSEENNNQAPLEVGYKLHQYKIRKKLAAGAFGVTYIALDTSNNTPVVIKEYFPSGLALRSSQQTQVESLSSEQHAYQEGLRRFEREAMDLGKFNEPNIVKILGYFKANNTAYFIMPMLEGQSLEEYQKQQNRALTEQEIVEQCLPVLKGLAAVHKAGMLHFDLKPDNILQTKYGEPVLIDFGGARTITSQGSAELSKHSNMLGTPGFYPPEQATTEIKQTPATDLYAFGMTLYNLMAPKQSLSASGDRQTAQTNDLPDPLKPIRQVVKGYSEALYQAVEACTQLKQKDRPQSVAALQTILAPLFQAGGGNKAALQAMTENTDKTILTGNDKKLDSSNTANTDKNRSAKKPFKAVLVMVLLLGLIGGGYQYNQYQIKQEAEALVQEEILEAERLAQENRLAEKKRKTAEATQLQQAGNQQVREVAVDTSEQRIADEQRVAKEQRASERRKNAEAKRLAEKRKADKARQEDKRQWLANRKKPVSKYLDFDKGHGNEFVKLDSEGYELPDAAKAWSCVYDKKTGAYWVAKMSRVKWSKDRSDYWGATEYRRSINAKHLCGFNDWKVPSLTSIKSLLSYYSEGKAGNATTWDVDGKKVYLNTKYFKLNGLLDLYSSERGSNSHPSRYIKLTTGKVVSSKNGHIGLRLARGKNGWNNNDRLNGLSYLTGNVFYDSKNNLTWYVKEFSARSYGQAQQKVKALNKKGLLGNKNWRLPSINELTHYEGVVDRKNVFSQEAVFWSSTTDASYSGNAWVRDVSGRNGKNSIVKKPSYDSPKLIIVRDGE